MKNNSKKTYVILSIALVVCLGGIAFFGYDLFFKEKSLKMENFENASKKDVLMWVTKNKLEDKIKYVYDYSDTIEEGNVISQSIKENENVVDEFTITISKGSIISLNVSEYKTKAEFDSFISQYPNIKVSYENGDSASNYGEILKFSKDSVDIKSDNLVVYLSSDNGKTIDDDKKDDNKDEKTGNTATIPNNLLGVEEAKFIKTVNDLGFKNLKKSEIKYYSFTSKKDTIYSYDDGKIDTGKTINYAISLGDYPSAFNAKEYDGQTLDAVNKIVKKYNDLNAHITLTTTNLETEDSKLIGKLANTKCKKEGFKSIVTANIYVAKSKTISVSSYAGKTEDTMLKELKDLGFTKFNKQSSRYSTYAKNSVLYNDTGNKLLTDTINYYLSLGIYEYSGSEFIDKTLDNANSRVNYHNNLGAHITLVTNDSETDTQADHNKVVSCTPAHYNTDKVTLTCTVLKYVEKYTLVSLSNIKQIYQGDTYDETVSKLKNYFNGNFTNVTYNGISSEDYGPGVIVDIKVDGQDINTNTKYKSDVNIVVTIVKTRTN